MNEIQQIKETLSKDNVNVAVKDIEKAVLLPETIPPIEKKEEDPKAKKTAKKEPE